MTVSRGKVHEYLGMTLDFTVRRTLKLTMVPYIEEIVFAFEKYDIKSDRIAATPAANHYSK